jgi:RNA polymerase sigma-70 factor (ECF subfamily)
MMSNGLSPVLIRSAVAGDHRAILQLLEAAQPNIRRYARSACRASDIDDAVQETLWLVYRRVGALRAAAAFSRWMWAVVRRECLRLARRFETPLSNTDEGQYPAAVSDRELRLDLAEAIQSLPQHYRVVVVMRDIEERTIDEIAAALAETREAVKGRLYRARLLLREYLAR